MLAGSRRIYVYWLLLLLPTLAVGAGALVLLRREQARLVERSTDALESRRASSAARARLTVETIELLVGDVESGLLDTLVGEPADGLDTFLDRWEKENPLVRTAFRLAPDGRVVRPDARNATEDGRAFLRRFVRQFGAQPPWVVTAPTPSAPPTIAPEQKRQVSFPLTPSEPARKVTLVPDPRPEPPASVKAVEEPPKQQAVEPEVRKEIGANVAQAQQARRDVQDLARNRTASNSAANSFSPASNSYAPQSSMKFNGIIGSAAQSPDAADAKKLDQIGGLVSKDSSASFSQNPQVRREVQELLKTPAYSNTNNGSQTVANPYQTAPSPPTKAEALDAVFQRAQAVSEKKAEVDRPVATEQAARVAMPATVSAAVVASGDTAKSRPEAAAPLPQAKDLIAERRGWLPVNVDGRMHLVGWVQLAGMGEVRGVEVDLAELVKRFGGALPASVGAGEGYALRDDQGRVLHVVGAASWDFRPAARIPLATSLLPGWEVVGYLSGGVAQLENTSNFVWVSALLVGIFLLAILAGGSLLLWQARRSEAEAAQKTSFVANVSHEFKTPLTTIRLYSELLEQGRVRDAAQGHDYLRTIGRETQRLARLVNNALDFSRLEQGKKKFALEPLDLTAELGRLLDTHAPRVAEAGLKLNRDLPASALTVTTDRDALEQIVLNLIDNACKYADGGEVVLVSLAARAGGSSRASVLQTPATDAGEASARQTPYAGGGAVIRVADRGPGVPVEHRERIFEKFHRVDDALTAEKSGAGLGLSIARQLARGLGGELHYAPREGGGAAFILELP